MIETYADVSTTDRGGRGQDVEVHIDVDRSSAGGVASDADSGLLFGEQLCDLDLLVGGGRGTASTLSSCTGGGKAGEEGCFDLHVVYRGSILL